MRERAFYRSVLAGATAASLLLSSPAYGDDWRQKVYQSAYRRGLPVYISGRLFVPPRRPPEESVAIGTSSNGDIITIHSSRREGRSVAANQSDNARRALQAAQREIYRRMAELRSKGYIR